MDGIVTVLNTPFTEADVIDVDGLQRNVANALEAGVSGFLVGALVTWVAAGKHRRRVRKQRTEIRTLEGELSDVRARLASQTKSD